MAGCVAGCLCVWLGVSVGVAECVGGRVGVAKMGYLGRGWGGGWLVGCVNVHLHTGCYSITDRWF